MTQQDLIITPIYLLLFLIAAYLLRSNFSNSQTSNYFIPALLFKFIGAIALGLIYQFYYGGGDTFTFHTHGSHWIWEAFMDDPIVGFKLFTQEPGNYNGETYAYTSKIWMFKDRASMAIIKLAAAFDLLTFGTYSSTALFFAAFAFSGQWAVFSIFQKIYPDKTRWLAFSILFVPSVVFWGSGILKDSITLAALCWMTFALFRIFQTNNYSLANILILVFMAWVIYAIKIYILLCFIVAACFYLYIRYISTVKNTLVKLMIAPILISLFLGGGYLALEEVAEDDSRYALDKIGETAMITAYDIRYGWGARHGDNSGYTLGELDGSLGSLIRLAPSGIIVTLFRPWVWEVKNPLMLLAAMESLAFLLLTIWVLYKTPLKTLIKKLNSPVILFCLSFALMFAFAVGVSTYNFGTLMRYKIPVMPFYSVFLVLIFPSKSDQKAKK
ncbi:hypothetical protein [Reichenbachiella ulvae]|uniref:Dolichyl-phosphate-mannose-protein mannosyltransferase n=1 Tax=Reichenbachiella ulvae TaxID=2980104 RepID=A0ABT3CVY8_9BACT|nr:hypothetical protein [Reichenbachiella ulvae]MCV9387713.1 hypothetical protein [Reichenbachiella ulvae]